MMKAIILISIVFQFSSGCDNVLEEELNNNLTGSPIKVNNEKNIISYRGVRYVIGDTNDIQ